MITVKCRATDYSETVKNAQAALLTAQKSIHRVNAAQRTLELLTKRTKEIDSARQLLEAQILTRKKKPIEEAVGEVERMLGLLTSSLDHAQFPTRIDNALQERVQLARTLYLEARKKYPADPHRIAYLEYIAYIQRKCGFLDSRGIMQTVRSVTLELDEVYIALTAERESRELEDWRQKKSGEAEEEYRKRIIQEKRESVVQKVTLEDVVREQARTVFLGDPGSGKTTLLRFLTNQFAVAHHANLDRVIDKDKRDYGETRLPILFRIADYAEAFQRSGNRLTVRDFLPSIVCDIPAEKEDLTYLLLKAIEDSKAILLMDGLDEILDGQDRQEIVKQIELFANNHPGNKFIVSSRIIGYRAAPLEGEFAKGVVTLQPLEIEQVKEFLDNWCLAVEKFQRPDLPETEWKSAAERQIKEIISAYEDNPGVRRLATNPLLLTILALIQRNGTRLPERRVELYKLATLTLLRDWGLARGGHSDDAISENQAYALLGPLAYEMHKSEANGLVTEHEALTFLSAVYAKRRRLSPDDPAVVAAIKDFLRRVRGRAGLLIERAPGYYGFLHLTFEEYFAAQFLKYKPSETASQIKEVRKNPRWQEPIRLAIADENDEVASDLIENAILGPLEPVDAGYKPDAEEFILAALCIGDAEDVLPAVQKRVADGLVETYLNLNIMEEPDRSKRKEICTALQNCSLKVCGSKATERLLEALPDANHAHCASIHRALARAASLSNRYTRELLFTYLMSDNALVRDAAAWHTGKAARENEELREEITSRQSQGIGFAAALALATPIDNNSIENNTQINLIDRSEVIIIPAGWFWRGSGMIDSEMPPRWIYLDAYSISKYPVTVAQYETFCKKTNRKMPEEPSFNPKWSKKNHPIVNVNWNDAQEYCKWAGLSLPSEAQWEKAARGTDGRKYPWGEVWDDQKCRSSKKYGDSGGTTDVGSYPDGISPYGVHDMAGNVWEWCEDWYDHEYYSRQETSVNNPMNSIESLCRVLRGGSWNLSGSVDFRCAVRFRNAPVAEDVYYGFRLAQV